MNIAHRTSPGIIPSTLALLLLALAMLPFAAAAACSGKLSDLQSYSGKYRAHDDLLAAPAIAARLTRLPQETQLHLKRNLDVSGPVQLVACHLRVAGNLPHQGGIEGAMLDVDLKSGTVIGAIHSGGRIDIYVIPDPASGMTHAAWDALPKAMREWAVRADSGFSIKHPRSLAEPASVRLHVPPNAPAAMDASAQTKVKLDFGKDAVKPTPAQEAAIRHVAGDSLDHPLPGHAGEPLYTMALADLNDDGRADLLVQYDDMAFCGSSGCSGVIVMATPHGYSRKVIDLPNFYGEIDILPTQHGGMHDLQYGDSPIWKWNGKEYQISRSMP